MARTQAQKTLLEHKMIEYICTYHPKIGYIITLCDKNPWDKPEKRKFGVPYRRK